MKVRSPLFSVLLAAAALCAGCSSLPTQKVDVEETTIRKQALEYVRLGDEAIKSRDYSRAEDDYRLSLEANASVDSLEGMSQAYNSLGNLYLGLGSYDTANDAFMNAEKQARFAKDDHLIALALANRAKVFLAQSKPQDALTLIDQSLQMMGKTQDADTAVILHNRGVALKDLGNTEEAKKALQASLAINESLKTLRERAANHYVLASIASKESKPDDAVKELTAALDLDKKAENSQGIAADLYALATIYSRKAEKADLESAWNYAVRSYRVSLAASDAVDVERSLTQLISLAATLNFTAEGANYKMLLDKLQANKLKAAASSSAAGGGASSNTQSDSSSAATQRNTK